MLDEGLIHRLFGKRTPPKRNGPSLTPKRMRELGEKGRRFGLQARQQRMSEGGDEGFSVRHVKGDINGRATDTNYSSYESAHSHYKRMTRESGVHHVYLHTPGSRHDKEWHHWKDKPIKEDSIQELSRPLLKRYKKGAEKSQKDEYKKPLSDHRSNLKYANRTHGIEDAKRRLGEASETSSDYTRAKVHQVGSQYHVRSPKHRLLSIHNSRREAEHIPVKSLQSEGLLEGWHQQPSGDFSAWARDIDRHVHTRKFAPRCPGCKGPIAYHHMSKRKDNSGDVMYWEGKCPHCNTTKMKIFNGDYFLPDKELILEMGQSPLNVPQNQYQFTPSGNVLPGLGRTNVVPSDSSFGLGKAVALGALAYYVNRRIKARQEENDRNARENARFARYGQAPATVRSRLVNFLRSVREENIEELSKRRLTDYSKGARKSVDDIEDSGFDERKIRKVSKRLHFLHRADTKARAKNEETIDELAARPTDKRKLPKWHLDRAADHAKKAREAMKRGNAADYQHHLRRSQSHQTQAQQSEEHSSIHEKLQINRKRTLRKEDPKGTQRAHAGRATAAKKRAEEERARGNYKGYNHHIRKYYHYAQKAGHVQTDD